MDPFFCVKVVYSIWGQEQRALDEQMDCLGFVFCSFFLLLRPHPPSVDILSENVNCHIITPVPLPPPSRR